MKTEYQARGPGIHVCWTTDLTYLRENFRRYGQTLWQRQTETPEEAAVRRMAALDNWQSDALDKRKPETVEPVSSFADRLSPPPTATECQVDWDTLEPVKEVPVWQFPWGIWVAGVKEDQYLREENTVSLRRMAYGRSAYGHTRESALRNLAELQSVKPQ